MSKLLKSRYEIKEKLGENHFSITYVGRAIEGGEKVVVRIYKRYLLDSTIIQELKNRVEALKQLKHPHIARVFDGDYGWQGFYFVREYVEGVSLEERLRRDRTIPHEEALQLLHQVAEALRYAHQAGVLHGGLHPSNVLIGYDQSVKVADFMIDGMIRATDRETAISVIQGTPFLAPEQMRGFPLTPSVDQYLLGSLLYLMVTGKTPFQNGEKQLSLSHSLRKLQERPEGIPEKEGVAHFLNALFDFTLSPDPLTRFSSIDEFCQSLSQRAIVRKGPPVARFRVRYETEKFSQEEIPFSQEPLRKRVFAKIERELPYHQSLRGLLVFMILGGAVLLGYALVQIIWFH